MAKKEVKKAKKATPKKKCAAKKVAEPKKAAPTKCACAKDAEIREAILREYMSREEFVILHMDYVGGDGHFWRQIVVPTTLTLDDLHYVIQPVFGWLNYHAYVFEQGSQHYDTEQFIFENPIFADSKPLEKTLVKDLFKKIGDKAEYVYDLGDYNVINVTCVGFSNDVNKSDFGTEGQDLIEDAGGLKGTPSIIKLLTRSAHTKKARECCAWLDWAFEYTPEEVLRAPDVREIYLRTISALKLVAWRE